MERGSDRTYLPSQVTGGFDNSRKIRALPRLAKAALIVKRDPGLFDEVGFSLSKDRECRAPRQLSL